MSPLTVVDRVVRSASDQVELLGIELLEEHARRLAASFTVSRRPLGGGRTHLRRLAENRRALTETYNLLAGDVRRGELASPAMEWLLDNFYVIAGAGRDVVRDLPPAYFRRLPTIAADDFQGMPRIYALALELIRTSSGQIDAQRLSRFIVAFQSVTPLTIGELWAWSSVLKLALIEHLRGRADVMVATRADRQHADRVAQVLERRPSTGSEQWPDAVGPAFATRLLQRFREYGEVASGLRAQLTAALDSSGLTVADAIRAEGQHQAAQQASMTNLIGSLRLISSFDWSEFFESVSLVEHVLQRDPAGVYARMDFRSRDRYRHAIEELADPTGEGQLRVALKSVEFARRVAERTPDARGAHVGEHLIGNGRRQFERSVDWVPKPGQRIRRLCFRYATKIYLGAIGAGALLLAGAALRYAYATGRPGATTVAAVALLTLILASEFVIQVVQRLVSALIPPRRLPRLEFERIPTEARTMVVIPTLLEDLTQVKELLSHLEVQALGNFDPQIHFALLTDFRDAVTETKASDDALVAEARLGIAALNRKHTEDGVCRFFLFHRQRLWNESEGVWMGWERKRGKIEEFNQLLRGATTTSFVVTEGDLTILPHVRYCITLDRDTRLPRDVARQLIGIIAHPLNRPRFDPARGRVVEGYGILQPRISVTFTSAAGSLFARIYSGHTGVDPYTTAVSDTYQDLYGEGIFTGKGLYDVDAFNAALAGSVPENALLSHDLFEGLYARVALVSDIELVDEYPSSVLVHARRQHRWIRGDWQILMWLFPFVPSREGLTRNTLPVISRWKILDNLRRSLVAPALLLLLAGGWTVLPGAAWVWTFATLGVLASQLLPIVAGLITGPRRAQSVPVFVRNLAYDAATVLAQISLSLTFVAFQAFDTVHAIVVTLIRVAVTKRRLLEWETATSQLSRTRIAGASGLNRFSTAMMASPLISVAVAVAILASHRSSLQLAAPFLLLWAVAPAIAYRLSLPAAPRVRPLTPEDRALLRRIANDTWRYFDTFVTEGEGWLPPDNYQEGDGGRVARRTSPTNVGMALLSALAAHDLGYLTTAALVTRVRQTLTTLEGLERFEGHFLNWYDTSTLAPLHPRYVSTVDSGNLAGALIALSHGLSALTEHSQTDAQLLAGLADGATALAAVASLIGGEPSSPQSGSEVNRLARSIAGEARRGFSDGAPLRLEQLAAELQAVPFDDPTTTTARPSDIAYWRRAVLDTIEALRQTRSSEADACRSLAQRAARLAEEMRFGFLYDRRKRIFAIGYRLADANGPGQLDGSFYDLLASEARLASFVAISKGDVPQQHWFHLGRPVTNINGQATLLSWGGTMFEYMMPLLLMRTFAGTLLDQSARASVVRQREYGRQQRAPWGISESAYAFADHDGNYQYPNLWRSRSRIEARPGERPGGRTVRDGAGGAGRPWRGRTEPGPPGPRRTGRPVRHVRIDRLPAAEPGGRCDP